MKKRKKEIDMDTVIAPMNIEGMPWHDKTAQKESGIPPKELRGFTLNAMLAALAVCLVFIGAGFLFICFCIYIWFR